MMATGHQAMGLTWGVGAITLSHMLPIPLNGIQEIIGFLIAVMIGSILPDMDSMNSKIGKYAYPIALIIVIVSVSVYHWANEWFWTFAQEEFVFLAALMVPIFLVFSSHRTWTHSLIFVALLGVYFQLLSTWVSIPLYLQIGCVLGVASHIFGDYLTKRGVPLLYPFKRKYYRFLFTFRTGSITEKGLVIALVLTNAWLLIG